MHALLERQIRKYLEPAGLGHEALRPFLEAVERAYQHGDTTRRLAEHSLVQMSQELTGRNAALLNQLAEGQRAEAQLEQLLFLLGTTLESTADGILVLDRAAKTVRFNRSFSEMWRVPDEVLAFWSHDTLMHHLLAQLVEPQAFAEKLEHLCRHPELEWHDTFECLDGRVIERHSLPQFQGIDNIGRVLSFHDITKRRQAETALLREKEEQQSLIRRLEEAHNQLLQSEKMASVGQLAAGVAHEINNPIGFVNSNLGALRGYIDQLLAVLAAYEAEFQAVQDGVPAGPARERIKAAVAAAELDYLKTDILALLDESSDGLARVRRIVQDLKEFSHSDQGEWIYADLHKGLESTLNVVNNELKYKARVVKAYGDLPLIRCLPTQLNQVFMNLLVNAAHAIEQQGEIGVRTGIESDRVWVEISDSGAGIPEHLLTRIFDPFFTTKPVGKGTGLGLSISYGIVQKHGGCIEVNSAVGKGSVFRITLPINSEETDHG